MRPSGDAFTQFKHNRFTLWTASELQRDSNGEVRNILAQLVELEMLIQSLENSANEKRCKKIANSFMNPLVHSMTEISKTIKTMCSHKFALYDQMNVGCLVCSTTNFELIVQYANNRAIEYSTDLLGKNLKNIVSFLFEDSMQKLQLFVKEHHDCIELLGCFCGHMFKFMGSWIGADVLFCMYKL